MIKGPVQGLESGEVMPVHEKEQNRDAQVAAQEWTLGAQTP